MFLDLLPVPTPLKHSHLSTSSVTLSPVAKYTSQNGGGEGPSEEPPKGSAPVHEQVVLL